MATKVMVQCEDHNGRHEFSDRCVNAVFDGPAIDLSPASASVMYAALVDLNEASGALQTYSSVEAIPPAKWAELQSARLRAGWVIRSVRAKGAKQS